MKYSLGFKLTLGFVVAVLLISSALSFYLLGHENELFRTELRKRGLALATNLAFNAEYGILVKNDYILTELVRGIKGEDDVLYAMILNVEGRVLSHTDPTHKGTRYIDQISLQARAAEKPLIQLYTDAHGEPVYDIAVPVKTFRDNIEKGSVLLFEESVSADEETRGGTPLVKIGFVRLGLSLKRMSMAIQKARNTVIFITLFVSAMGIIATAFFVRFIVRPIKELLRATEQIAQGNLEQHMTIASGDEIGELARSFNKMSQDLKRSRAEIEEYSRTLEKKVRERTGELEESYRQLKETHEQLVQAGKMAAMGQLGAGVAHELNNPLGGILGFSQRILELFSQRPAPDAEALTKSRSYVEIIERETKRCKEIVEKLLRFSRRSDEVFHEVDINHIIQETLLVVSHQLERAHIRCNLTLADSLPFIKGNANQLQQVFTNLILNAKKAMPDGGEISIRSRLETGQLLRVEVAQLDTKGNYVVIDVEDTGMGIGAGDVGRIFEPFFTTSSPGEGTGLGLSVSYAIIRDHSGVITVESEVGRGSTFTVWLPIPAGGQIGTDHGEAVSA
ncbi:MAG: HAMP domain-containing protein [Candidatus Omnitrophica bacterium]|nr:HAMP domain-containing protein [Candidatus Omnitrophota bacterium]